jgi:hypothetical protein
MARFGHVSSPPEKNYRYIFFDITVSKNLAARSGHQHLNGAAV